MPSGISHAPSCATSAALAAIYERRTVRSYTSDVVGVTQLQVLLEAAVHAPTAMHREPWQFVIIQDRHILEQISDEAKVLLKADAAANGNLLKPRGAPGDGIPTPVLDPNFNIFYDAGTLVVICAAGDGEFVAADCWLAAANLMLAAPAEGLATACIGFSLHALNTPEIKARLGIPAESRAYAGIIVGVPRGETLPSPRKPPVILEWIRS
jgi:nitroreductase